MSRGQEQDQDSGDGTGMGHTGDREGPHPKNPLGNSGTSTSSSLQASREMGKGARKRKWEKELGAQENQEVPAWGPGQRGGDREGPHPKNPPGNSRNSTSSSLQASGKREKEPRKGAGSTGNTGRARAGSPYPRLKQPRRRRASEPRKARDEPGKVWDEPRKARDGSVAAASTWPRGHPGPGIPGRAGREGLGAGREGQSCPELFPSLISAPPPRGCSPGIAAPQSHAGHVRMEGLIPWKLREWQDTPSRSQGKL